MKWNRRENPKRNGDYLVCYKSGYKTVLGFTLNGGWNTHYTYDGKLFKSASIGHNMVTAGIKGWMPFPEWED